MPKPLILIIDDDHMSNVFNSMIITKYYPQVQIHDTTGASEAINYLKSDTSDKPSLILLDLNMPVMNGWDFMEEYEKLNLGIEVVLVTSSSDIRDLSRAKDYNDIKHYLVKPISVKDLKEVMEVFYK